MTRAKEMGGLGVWDAPPGGPRLAEEGEFALIRRIRESLAGALPAVSGLVRGIGDDTCSFLPGPGMEVLLTADSVVEGRHFLREFSTPYQVGRRTMAMNLSDIGAMGGVPRIAVVSLGLPATLPVAAVEELYRGFVSELAPMGCCIAGGNVTGVAGEAFIDVTLLGEVERGRAVWREGARAGDVLLLTGWPGAAAAGLASLRRDAAWACRAVPDLVASYRCPVHRGREGRAAGESGLVHSMLDVSDGLLGDLGHMCTASGVGARVEAARLPRHPQLVIAAERLEVDALQSVLRPSDDYELLLACAPGDVETLRDLLGGVGGVPVTAVGEIVPGSQIEVVDASGGRLDARGGWDHFAQPD